MDCRLIILLISVAVLSCRSVRRSDVRDVTGDGLELNIKKVQLYGHQDPVHSVLVSYRNWDRGEKLNLTFVKQLSGVISEINSKRGQKDRVNLSVIGASQISDLNLRETILSQGAEEFQSLSTLEAGDAVQDEFEYLSVIFKSNSKPKNLVLDTLDRNDDFARELADRIDAEFMPPLFQEFFRFDDGYRTEPELGVHGGNIEVTPNDVLYIGSTSKPTITNFFAEHGYSSRMVSINTDWLYVGHVDEMVSTILTPETACGFTIVKASLSKAISLLKLTNLSEIQDIPSVTATDFQADSRELQKWQLELLHAFVADPSRNTFPTPPHIILNDENAAIIIKQMRDYVLNGYQKIQAKIDNSIEILKRKIVEISPKCENIDIVELPVLYICEEAEIGCSSLNGNPVNMLVLDQNILMDDPLLSKFQDEVKIQLSKRNQRVFFMDATGYNINNSGVHCATNVIRSRKP